MQLLQKYILNKKSPLHVAPDQPYILGGPDPLDGISIYDGGEFWHFVTYGFSELYEKENDCPEISGYGFELTFKLQKACINQSEKYDELINVCKILQTIAKWIFKGHIEPIDVFQYIFPKQNKGIDCRGKSGITGLISVPENLIKKIKTPHGSVEFIELIGVTTTELNALENKEITVRELYQRLNSDITDYSRASILATNRT